MNEFQVGHIGLTVSDLERSRSFYESVFGFKTLIDSTEGERFALLGYEGPVVTLWEQASAAFEASRSGLHHLSFQVESADRVRDVEKNVRSLGATFLYDKPMRHGEGFPSGGNYFTDPDGLRLEVSPRAGSRTRPRSKLARPVACSRTRWPSLRAPRRVVHERAGVVTTAAWFLPRRPVNPITATVGRRLRCPGRAVRWSRE